LIVVGFKCNGKVTETKLRAKRTYAFWILPLTCELSPVVRTPNFVLAVFLANVHVRYMLSPVRLSVVCLSVTFVRPTQAVQIFGNISTALRTLAID